MAENCLPENWVHFKAGKGKAGDFLLHKKDAPRDQSAVESQALAFFDNLSLKISLRGKNPRHLL